MPIYHYRACNDQGTMIDGKEFAEDMDHFLQFLEERKLHPIHVTAPETEEAVPTVEEVLSKKLPVPKQQIAVVFDQLAMMLDSGLSIVEALQSLEEQKFNLRLKNALTKIRKQVEEGIPLHLAIRDCSDVFDEASIRVVEAGEQTGQLDVALIRLTEMIEFDIEIRKKFKEATRYPKIVVGTLCIAIGILITVVIPRFSTLFTRANIDLPILTKVLLFLQAFLTQNWPLLLFFLLLLYIVHRMIHKDPNASEKYEHWKMKIPLWGGLTIKIELSRIFRILAMLIESGVDILSSLKLASCVTQNKVVTKAFLEVRENLEEGNSLASSVENIPLFPSMARRILILGEKTGRLSESFEKVSKIYERQTTGTIKKISSMLEPVLIISIGLVIIIFALGIFLPMWDLIKVIR